MNGRVKLKENARIFVSLPFRAEGLEAEHPGCLKEFDSRQIDRFLQALEREIGAVSEESEDLLVREIVLGNGSASHFTADDLTRMIRTIRAKFSVHPQCQITFIMTPAGFDFFKLSAIRQMGNTRICFELPSLEEEGLRRGGYNNQPENAQAALDCCFQNGYRRFSVILTEKSMDANEMKRTLSRLLDLHPESIVLQSDIREEILKAGDAVLLPAHWNRFGYGWYRDGMTAALQCTAQIGCGPGAISIFDKTSVKTTDDFEFYCEHSDDFEALVTHQNETEH